MIASVDNARSVSVSPALTPSLSMNSCAIAVARSRVAHHDDAPLCGIALWNRPRAAGMPSSVPTDPPPADSPNTVTFVGIAAERGDGVAHPLERGGLVEDARVAGARELRAEQVGEVQEPERARAGS